MDTILKVAFFYVFLLVLLRIAGKRTLASTTTFDIVLLLVISETVQQALVGEDRSVTNACLLIGAFVAMDILLSIAKHRSPLLAAWLDDVPTVLVREGVSRSAALDETRVEEEDILEAARSAHGIESLDEVRHAVLERDGTISIVPFSQAPTSEEASQSPSA